ncbi:HlyD family efflux transporter periplasmic adaptor subunit [Halieaceae bacterium IMCC14734]|uniref:HlyD family efflux transporter periplasmic adaptor subunit n=1 Tax=Candidatus Litorirhabdus singularis TaxID=2518993 RepID=A0ABT3TCQ3_9GAMM|nr:HlyD family efflux transporter periplasmic adaptor subunit [Candidatus Litorirhabdus singularis]MCX2979610.1 HlyD family efflux transporter periplasmic adaptor subunit [Candidatus Litorirhabdus singularis]
MTTSERIFTDDNGAIVLPDSLERLDRLLQTTDEHWHYVWLVWLCEQLPGVAAALVVTDDSGAGQFHARALWPQETGYDQLLQDAAATTLEKQTPLLSPLDDGANHLGSYPIFINERLRAVVTVLFTGADEASLQRVLAAVEYCSGWLELGLSRTTLDGLGHQNERQQVVIDSIANVLGERDFDHAALRFVNLIGRHLNAERVVLGFVRGGEIHIHSQSDSSGHSKKHELVKHTAAAMQEAVDQQQAILWPAPESHNSISLAHARLADAAGRRTLLTVPLVDKELCYGAVLFERGLDDPFTEQEQVLGDALANYVGVVLEEKRQSSLPLYSYVGRSLRNQTSRLLGPGYLVRKLVLLALVAVTLFFTFMPGDYNLGTEAVLEGAELRAIVVPFEGYLQSASFRAGDKVSAGALLAELETRELRLQRMSWTSQQATSRRQYEDALARQERAQVQIAKAQMDRAAAELELLDYQISQATMVAPFDALLVSGDLSQRIGSVVRQGDVLFELSPSGEYRLALYVDEFRINDVEAGQPGRLVLSALPDTEFSFVITRINPVAEVRDGATVYRVEAQITGDVESLRVGLEGVAKVTIDERLLISIWTRGVRDWLRMQIWRFWG